MRRTFLLGVGFAVLAVGWHDGPQVVGQVPFNPVTGGPMEQDGPRFPDFNTVTRGAKVHEGLFKLYQKDDRLYLELTPDKMNRPFLCPIAVARGAGKGGETLNADEQWVLLFKRVGDKVHLVRRNVHFKAKAGSPTARAVETTYSDSVLMALRIAAVNQMNGMAPLINLNDVFMTDFAELGLGMFDANRSYWSKVKTFPRNVEIEVQATYAARGGPMGFHGGGDETIDPRGTTVVVHYGLADLNDAGYQPRVADDRIGHFVTAVKDFSSDSKDTAFVRNINRWRLERAEPADPKNPGKLSVPTKSIKFYIEKTVPHEYRAAVQEGVLEWNKAFEKIGFRNAIEVVQQRDDEDWDPEDMNYNTIRWITRDTAFAMGPFRANPMTGEILDADIIFDADVVRYWKRQSVANSPGTSVAEPVSPVQAMDAGWGLDRLMPRPSAADGSWNDMPRRTADDPGAAHQWAIRQGICQCGSRLQFEMGMAAMTMAARADGKATDKVTDEMVAQAVKSIIMHEVGHTLGLRHNFKGSAMLPNDQLHDTKITREKGLIGSVMDYAPVNLAPKGAKQGDYFTTTLGPYDYWAIEYAYKPADAAELKKVAARSGEPGLDFGTDEDVMLSADPLANRFDLGNDVLQFARDRMILTEELLQGLATRVVDEGEGYQRARVALDALLKQYGDGAYFVSKYVGGEHVYRDHRGDPKGREPLVPVPAAKQRDALKFLQEHVFSEKPYQLPPDLLRKLAVDRWVHWGSEWHETDFPLYDRVLGIQRLALSRMLNPAVLRRIQANALKADKAEQALTMAEVFRAATDAVWGDLPNGGPGEENKAYVASVMKRNLQREYIAQLANLVLGRRGGSGPGRPGLTIGDAREPIMVGGPAATPPDACSLARMHLRDISTRIQGRLNDKRTAPDETTVAHLEECRERIQKVLGAAMQVND
jgi:hypothetical protein